MRIVLLGPPGAGKGTQAVLISQHYNIPHISTGEILREAVAHGTELGSKAKSYLDSGSLVPDDLVIDLIKARLRNDDCSSGFLLDGFPRTLDQARALDLMLDSISSPLTHIIDIHVPESVLIDRISKRAVLSGRSDDNVDVLTKRLQVYWEQTAPISGYYSALDRLIKIDGLGTVSEVSDKIIVALN